MMTLLFLLASVLALSSCSVQNSSSTSSKESKPKISIAASTQVSQLSQGFALHHYPEKPAVQAQLADYRSSVVCIERMFARAAPYLYYITTLIQERDLPLELALVPAIESTYDPFAYSHGRAAGIWQFIPATGKHFGLEQNWWYDGRRDIHASTLAALDYLEYLHARFDEDWLLALAAYNAGQGLVSRAISRNKAAGKPTDFWSLALPKETRDYVPKLLALAKLLAKHEEYGLTPVSFDALSRLASVETHQQLDLALAAELADMTLDELHQLNPGFNRWTTGPDGPHRLLIPINKIEHFSARLAQAEIDTKWERYIVQRGDTLSEIATNFNTTVALLSDINRLPDHQIRIGDPLLIPIGARHDIAPPPAERRLASAQRGPQQHKTTYEVQAGDSLWTISDRHQVAIADLAQWNAIDADAWLYPGDTLAIWQPITHDDTDTTTLASGENIIRKISYTVRQNDSLGHIAQRYHVRLADLVNWNNLTDQKYLHPGQILTLYIDVTRQAAG